MNANYFITGYITKQTKQQSNEGMPDNAMLSAIRKQASFKSFQF